MFIIYHDNTLVNIRKIYSLFFLPKKNKYKCQSHEQAIKRFFRSIRSAIFSRISGYGDRAWRKGKLDRDHEASLEWGGRVREGYGIEGGHRDKGWENFHIERAANRDRRV